MVGTKRSEISGCNLLQVIYKVKMTTADLPDDVADIPFPLLVKEPKYLKEVEKLLTSNLPSSIETYGLFMEEFFYIPQEEGSDYYKGVPPSTWWVDDLENINCAMGYSVDVFYFYANDFQKGCDFLKQIKVKREIAFSMDVEYESALESNTQKITKSYPCHTFYIGRDSIDKISLPDENELKEKFEKEGVELCKLTIEDAPIVVKYWPYGDDPSYTTSLIKYKPSVGIRKIQTDKNEDNNLVCWITTNNCGACGLLHTIEEERRKGYSAIVLRYIIHEVYKTGRIPFLFVVKANTPSFALMAKILDPSHLLPIVTTWTYFVPIDQ